MPGGESLRQTPDPIHVTSVINQHHGGWNLWLECEEKSPRKGCHEQVVIGPGVSDGPEETSWKQSLGSKSCHSVSATSGFHTEPHGAISGAPELSKVRKVSQGQVCAARLNAVVNALALTQSSLVKGVVSQAPLGTVLEPHLW